MKIDWNESESVLLNWWSIIINEIWWKVTQKKSTKLQNNCNALTHKKRFFFW